MIAAHHAAPDEVPHLVVGADRAARDELRGADLGQRRRGAVVARHPHSDGERVEVAHIGQVAGVDERPVPRVARGKPQPPPARHVRQLDEHGHRAASRVGQPLLPVRHRQDEPLQVRGGQPRVTASEPARLGDVRGQRAPVGQPPAGEAAVACRLPQALHAGGGPEHGHRRVVDQVGAYRRHVGDHVDAVLAQVVRRPDAGQHEQLRRPDRARGQDHLGLGPRRLLPARGAEGHPGRAAALDDQAGDEGVGDNRQVLRTAGQVGVGGAAPLAVPLSDLVEANAVLLRAVEVVVGQRAAPGRRLDEVLRVRRAVPQVLHRQRPARPVVRPRAARVVLRAQEIGQQFLVAPSGAAVLVPPGVVVQPVAADVDHRVHRRRAAEHLAARPVNRAPVGPLLRDRDVVPVVPSAEEPAVGRGDADLGDGRRRPARPRAAAPGCRDPRRAARPPRSPRFRRPRSRSRTQGYLTGKRRARLRQPGSGGPPRTAGSRCWRM